MKLFPKFEHQQNCARCNSIEVASHEIVAWTGIFNIYMKFSHVRVNYFSRLSEYDGAKYYRRGGVHLNFEKK